MIINACPVQSSSDWKELVAQVGLDTAWATWIYTNGDYPNSLISTKDLKEKLIISPVMSGSNILSLDNRLKKYNQEHGTGHSVTTKKVRGTDQHEVELKVSYFPANLELTRINHDNSFGLKGAPSDEESEYVVSKYEFRNVSGKLFSTKLYDNNIEDLYRTISKLNNENFANGINEVYSTSNKKRIGESHQYTIDIIKKYKQLNVKSKIERAVNRDRERNSTSRETQFIKGITQIPNSEKSLSVALISMPIFEILSGTLSKKINYKSSKDIELLKPEYSKLSSFNLDGKTIINSDKINIESPLYMYTTDLYLEDLKINDVNKYENIINECLSHEINNQSKDFFKELNTDERGKLMYNILVKLNNEGQDFSDFINTDELNTFLKNKFKSIINTDKDLDINLNSSTIDVLNKFTSEELFEDENSLFGNINQYLQKQIKSACSQSLSEEQFEQQLIDNGSIQTICKI